MKPVRSTGRHQSAGSAEVDCRRIVLKAQVGTGQEEWITVAVAGAGKSALNVGVVDTQRPRACGGRVVQGRILGRSLVAPHNAVGDRNRAFEGIDCAGLMARGWRRNDTALVPGHESISGIV